MEWQPIETAPKDGTVVLVTGENMGHSCPVVSSASYVEGAWWLDQWESPECPIEPDFWMPLSKPPKE